GDPIQVGQRRAERRRRLRLGGAGIPPIQGPLPDPTAVGVQPRRVAGLYRLRGRAGDQMSWDGRCTVKQYPMFVPGAGSLDNPVIVTPANARRTLLEIQVTSANPAFFRWDSLTSNV